MNINPPAFFENAAFRQNAPEIIRGKPSSSSSESRLCQDGIPIFPAFLPALIPILNA
jgi:hypothetical protein